jgi:biopolymer transport protein ExbD
VKLRQTDHEARVEIMPLIDVIFLLITFFIYAMVLMIRAELLPVQMQAFASGETARPSPVIALTIDRDGVLYLNREPIGLETVVARLRAEQAADPEAVIYLAADERGERDRLPVFLDLYDRLAFAGLDIKLVGRPKDEPAPGAATNDG